MTWQDVTVEKYQQLYDVWRQAETEPAADETELDALRVDMLAEMLAVCFDMTPQQVHALSLGEYKKLCSQIAFLQDLPEWKPVKHFTTEGRRYRFCYNVKHMRTARILEIKYNHKNGFVPKLHNLAASMVVPQRRTWYGAWKDAPFLATEYSNYAADIRQAPITAIYGSALFFSAVWKKLMPALTDYMTQTIPETERSKVRSLIQDSCRLMDGNTTSELLQSVSAYH